VEGTERFLEFTKMSQKCYRATGTSDRAKGGKASIENPLFFAYYESIQTEIPGKNHVVERES
jgi:hypothetical protein